LVESPQCKAAFVNRLFRFVKLGLIQFQFIFLLFWQRQSDSLCE